MRPLLTGAVALLALAAAAHAQTEDEPRVVDITDPDAPPIEDAENVIPEEEAELKAETGLTSPTHTAPTPGEEVEIIPSGGESATGMAAMDVPEGFSVADMATMDVTELLGVRVYTPDDDQVGEIDRWIGEAPGALPAGAVIDVGGFLGIAEREVAVETEALTLLTNVDGNDMRVYLDMSEDELGALPEVE